MAENWTKGAIRHDGNDHLSAHFSQMWALHQRIVLQFGVYTWFKYTRMHVGLNIPGMIEWWVPLHAADVKTLTEWIATQLEEICCDPFPPSGSFKDPWPGDKFIVYTFDNRASYLTAEERGPMVAKTMADLKRKLESWRNEGKRSD